MPRLEYATFPVLYEGYELVYDAPTGLYRLEYEGEPVLYEGYPVLYGGRPRPTRILQFQDYQSIDQRVERDKQYRVCLLYTSPSPRDS